MHHELSKYNCKNDSFGTAKKNAHLDCTNSLVPPEFLRKHLHENNNSNSHNSKHYLTQTVS